MSRLSVRLLPCVVLLAVTACGSQPGGSAAAPASTPLSTSAAASTGADPTQLARSYASQQAAKAPVADASSELQNLSVAEETYFADANAYTKDQAELRRDGYQAGSAATPFTVVLTSTSFCLQTTASDGTVLSYDSTRGGLQAVGKACAKVDATGAAFS